MHPLTDTWPRPHQCIHLIVPTLFVVLGAIVLCWDTVKRKICWVELEIFILTPPGPRLFPVAVSRSAQVSWGVLIIYTPKLTSVGTKSRTQKQFVFPFLFATRHHVSIPALCLPGCLMLSGCLLYPLGNMALRLWSWFELVGSLQPHCVSD